MAEVLCNFIVKILVVEEDTVRFGERTFGLFVVNWMVYI